jgi:penicillin-binding protein 1B
VVWVGYDDNRDLNLEGARSALPIWAEFMKRAARIAPYSAVKPFSPPSGIRSVEICAESGALAGPLCPNVRSELFLEGTEPARQCTRHVPAPVIETVEDEAKPQAPVTPPPGDGH